ncbi:hypothetical protein SELMODRAFT_413576 [Selaginella moellendorffii]|uniref:Uncharacterized protein n=1 Tax=Selaginella moellendorffii TaxID=88036 RepID=D8RQQ2_SELML|nr:hypothetical protein SELMODRAFT_413576 [Selaginella moellendorffii]
MAAQVQAKLTIMNIAKMPPSSIQSPAKGWHSQGALFMHVDVASPFLVLSACCLASSIPTSWFPWITGKSVPALPTHPTIPSGFAAGVTSCSKDIVGSSLCQRKASSCSRRKFFPLKGSSGLCLEISMSSGELLPLIIKFLQNKSHFYQDFFFNSFEGRLKRVVLFNHSIIANLSSVTAWEFALNLIYVSPERAISCIKIFLGLSTLYAQTKKSSQHPRSKRKWKELTMDSGVGEWASTGSTHITLHHANQAVPENILDLLCRLPSLLQLSTDLVLYQKMFGRLFKDKQVNLIGLWGRRFWCPLELVRELSTKDLQQYTVNGNPIVYFHGRVAHNVQFGYGDVII